VRLCLHPRGLAPRLLNLPEVRAATLRRIRRHAEATAAPDIRRLYEELAEYPAPQAEPRHDGELYVPFHLATVDGAELRFTNTIATFGSPLDISVESLAMESFFPADSDTAEYLRQADLGNSQRVREFRDQFAQLANYTSGASH